MSHPNFRVAAFAAFATTALLLVGCTSASPSPSSSPSPTHSAAPLVSTDLLKAEHVVTQEGLAIALASNVLQSQLQLVQAAFDLGNRGCVALPDGGSRRITAVSRATEDVQVLTNVLYYDSACTMKYMTQNATVSSVGDSIVKASTATDYTGVSGTALGRLTTSARATIVGSGLQLVGTGTFALANGTSVSLGLSCLPGPSSQVMQCAGGIAQDFPELKTAIGSVTPLRLGLGSSFNNPLSFSGTSNSFAFGTLKALRITSPDGKNLAIGGGTSVTGSPTTTGQAGGFVLFPATPTGWTITNQATGVKFSISVIDNTTRMLSGTIVQLSDQRALGSFSVDKSGSGTITYLGDKPAPITSWLLSR